MEAKPFSVGFRIEHPQSVIDRARWGRHAGHPLLGAADYKLVHHASNGRAVYSFCMCPGGTVVAATSEPGRVVTNGMSQYSRNERNANAGMVVGIDPQDYPTDPAAFEAALGATHGVEALGWPAPPARGHRAAAPARSQRLCAGRRQLQRAGPARGRLSGRPRLQGAGQRGALVQARRDVRPARGLPDYAIEALREALPAFGRKIKGFDMHDAVLTGVETRTSSPLKIGRGDDYQSLNTAACTRPAKARATRAAFCRGWTASRWAKRSRGAF
jgi:hypothetical protein